MMNPYRKDFPILTREVHGKPLVYLDNAATTQKPESVIRSLTHFYTHSNANVHRGVHLLSQEATDLYDGTRAKVCGFLRTQKEEEIIYTRGTTESINIVASSLGDLIVEAGDDIIVTRMEHHSNFVPWQALAQRKKAQFKIVELTSDYQIDMDSFRDALKGRPRIVSFTLMSNTLGVINPVSEMATLAKQKGAVVVVDAAQACAHSPLNVSELGPVDFIAFSAHKMFGPTGTGILWGRKELLEKMPPYQFGGDMIRLVEDQKTTWNDLPFKFEAGTPNIAGVIGLSHAIDYIQSIGFSKIHEIETKLTSLALAELSQIQGLKIIGPDHISQDGQQIRGPVISFMLDDIHPHDLATFLDTQGVAVRAGHHCTQPLMKKLGVPSTIRASFSLYNTSDEVYALVNALKQAQEYFL